MFIARILPTLSLGGSHAYAFDVLLNLSRRGFDVHVLFLDPCLLENRRPRIFEQIPGTPFRQICPGYLKIGNCYWHWKGILWEVRKRAACHFKFISKCPPLPQNALKPFLLPEEKPWIQAARDQAKWEVVICNYHWLSEAFEFFGPEVKKTVLTHDVWHQHVYNKPDDPLAEVNERAREQMNLSRADLIIAINSRDAEIFKAMLPQKKIVVAPMSCTAKFSDVTPASGQLLFVGSDYKPNADGASWFLNEVGPLLAKGAPGRFKLDLIGRVGHVLNGCKTSVPWVARGYVKDITPEYDNAEIVIVPLLAGTGLKIKLMEAFAHGKAIVTTSVGAQGLEKFAGQAFAVANTPEEFAAQLIKISNDRAERHRLESTSRRIALTDFSPISCYDELEKCLAS